MNSKHNIQASQRNKGRHYLFGTGMHPEGGFVAWPNGRVSRIKHEPEISGGTCVNRKGFVAWPSGKNTMA